MSLNIRIFLKYSLFTLNILFVIAGLVLWVIGIFLKTRDVPELIKEQWNTVNMLAIVVGGVVATVAFIGCYGAILENKIMLCLYTVSLIILAIAQTVMVVLIFRKRDQIHMSIPMYDFLIKNNAKGQQFLYIFELIIAGLAMLIIFLQVLAATASCFLGYGKRISKTMMATYE